MHPKCRIFPTTPSGGTKAGEESEAPGDNNRALRAPPEASKRAMRSLAPRVREERFNWKDIGVRTEGGNLGSNRDWESNDN